MPGVDEVLTAREARARTPAAGLAASFLLHVVVIAAAVWVPKLLAEPQRPVEYVPISIISIPQALGVPEPAPPPKPKPEPPKPEPEPEPEVEPPKPPDPDVPVLPDPKPAEPKPKPAEPKPAQRPEPPKPEPPAAVPGRAGSPGGSALGVSQFGEVGVEDPDFTYGYYLDQMLSLIRGQWLRPSLGSGVQATVHFVIRSNGTLEDVRLVESSGYSSFDLAALRAVQSASPLPPLPKSYKRDQLGVNLIVR